MNPVRGLPSNRDGYDIELMFARLNSGPATRGKGIPLQISNGVKAVQIHTYGGPEVLELVDIEKPKAGPGQVLIEAYASCINPVDTVIRQGYMAKVMPITFPATLGSDVAGMVAEVGEGVTDIAVGDKVYGSAIVLAGASGAFAEFVATPVGLIAPMPKNSDFLEAASVVLTGVSALQALSEHIKLQAGQSILIHGGAGGIGTIAIQIAKNIGARVTTTVASDEAEYVKSLGADDVIDYKTQAFDSIDTQYDAIFDTVGGAVYEASFKVVKRGGVIVSMVAPINHELAQQFGVTAITQFTKVTSANLNKLTGFIESGAVKVHIDKIFPFDKIKEAFQAKEAGGVKGKIGIKIK